MKKLMILFFAFAFSFSAQAQVPSVGLKPGDTAIPFKLKNIDGKMVALNDYAYLRGVILIFTCNHCPFSVAYQDRIIALNKKYASQGFPVIAINSNDADAYPEDSYDNMIVRASEKKFNFPYLLDDTQVIAKAYGAVRTPHVFILQHADNGFAVRYVGAIDDNSDDPAAVKTKYVENAITEIMKGKVVSEPFTKAIGCTIKWKK